MGELLVLDRLTKRFGSTTAVDDLTVEIQPGELVGMIGANGSGKTTTIRMLLGLLHPTTGRALIDGRDVRDVGARAGIGYLSDDPPLDDRWTVSDQLDWWEQLRGPAPAREQLEEALGVERSKRIGELSRGNRQKAAITMALMHNPRLVVMDEPATGLDPLVRHDLWNSLRAAARRGAAVFVSSHVLGDIETVCERVIVLRKGKVVFDGPVAALTGAARCTVTIEFAHDSDAELFAALPEVDVRSRHGRRLVLSVAGSVDGVVKAAAAFEVVDFTSTRPDLEGGFVDLNNEGLIS